MSVSFRFCALIFSIFLLDSTVVGLAGVADRSDGEAQISLSQALQDNPDEARRFARELKLDPPFDISAEIAANTAVEKVKGLDPLRLPDQDDPVGTTKDRKAFVAMATLWDKDSDGAKLRLTDGKLIISVCWVEQDAATARGRAITRDAVKATWENYGVIEFSGWETKCDPSSKGIRIAVMDERPWSYYGKTSNSYDPSMLLNFEFRQPVMAGCSQMAELCIWSIAVHEFGHALGFIHEQDSDKTPKWCKRKLDPADIHKPEAELKAAMLTTWDRYSVMDYCQDIYSRRVQLSDCDIAAYQNMYPAKTSYKPVCKVNVVQQ